MRTTNLILAVSVACFGCARPPHLPYTSQHNVISLLNDSTWFATGKAVRLVSDNTSRSKKQFNLRIVTDIDFPGNGSVSKSPTITGCLDECVPTQGLYIYNIPLRKGKYKLAKLDKRRTIDPERTNYSLLINGSGVYKNYQFFGSTPSWIRVTNINKQTNSIEGQFSFILDVNNNMVLGERRGDRTTNTAHFKQGLFNVKLTDVKIK